MGPMVMGLDIQTTAIAIGILHLLNMQSIKHGSI